MDIGAAFVAYAESSMLMKPSDRSFDHPAGLPQSTAMFGEATPKFRFNAPTSQLPLMGAGTVSAIALNGCRAAARSTGLAGDVRDGVNQRQQLRHVVSVGPRERHGQGNARGVGQHMMLAA